MADTILKLSRTLIQLNTKNDFFSDQLHYQVTFTILIIFAVASTSLQFYADPIQCVQPAQFTEGYTTFARTLCWLNNTYFYPQTYLRLPLNKNQRSEHTLHYYQWLPFVYLIQAFFFLFPHLIWINFFKRNGLNPVSLVNQGTKFDEKPSISRIISKEIERYLMCRQLARCQKKLLFRQNLISNDSNPSSTPLILPKVSFRIRSHNSYLVSLYLFVKILYIINLIIQFLLLNSILSTGKYGFIRFGFDTMKYLFQTSIKERLHQLSYQHQQLFPFVTLCDFHIRELGQDHSYTIECILLINIFYEKIYFAIWIWFCVLLLISICSLIYSIYVHFSYFSRERFFKKYFSFIRTKREQTLSRSMVPSSPTLTTNETSDEIDFLIDANRRRKFVHWIERDGHFLLQLLNSHVGEQLTVKCLEDLILIWIDNYEDKSKLAEKLFKNQFQFAK